MSMSACLWVCRSVCPREYLRFSGTTREIFVKFFMHVAYVRGSVLLRHVYDRSHRLSPGAGFLPLQNALSAGKVGWECTARAKYAIYDCLVIGVALGSVELSFD